MCFTIKKKQKKQLHLYLSFYNIGPDDAKINILPYSAGTISRDTTVYVKMMCADV